MNELYRPDLRQTLVHVYEYKGYYIEVYLIRKEWTVPATTLTGRRSRTRVHKKMSVHAVSYVKVGALPTSSDDPRQPTVERDTTFYENGVVGFDSNHCWYKTDDDTEQFKHISSAMCQAEGFIDRIKEVSQ